LLVTSAFHPLQHPQHCLEATRNIGALFRVLPFNIEVQVHPCITCEKLPHLLMTGPFAAWIHFSGDHAPGLYEVETKQYASPERWLTCFNNYPGGLQMVLLSARESAPVARLFAASGVRVAIGFVNKVTAFAAERLVEVVVPAALQGRDLQSAILDAFDKVCRYLSTRPDAHGGDRETWPRAFKVDLKSS
jgi:hypothetical protein